MMETTMARVPSILNTNWKAPETQTNPFHPTTQLGLSDVSQKNMEHAFVLIKKQ